MVILEATSKNSRARERKRKRRESNRPLLAQRFSVASKELRNLAKSTEIRALSTIDFYVDLDRRAVGQMSLEEPEGRLFNAKGDPVILGPGEQHLYLHERQQKLRNPNGKYEFLESVEKQHGGSLRLEPWYNDLFREDQLREAQAAGVVAINEQLRRAYGGRVMRNMPNCQDCCDQKHGISQIGLEETAVTQSMVTQKS